MWQQVTEGLFAGRQLSLTAGAVEATVFLYNTRQSDPTRHDCWVLTSNVIEGEGFIIGRNGDEVSVIIDEAKEHLCRALRTALELVARSS